MDILFFFFAHIFKLAVDLVAEFADDESSGSQSDDEEKTDAVAEKLTREAEAAELALSDAKAKRARGNTLAFETTDGKLFSMQKGLLVPRCT